MTASTATVGDIELCYEEFGNPADPAVLLIMGIGAQMVFWRPEFCQRLADQGYRVIRFDNRDCGLSTNWTVYAPAAAHSFPAWRNSLPE
ncbi:Probable lipase/esterase LipG [Mycobacteroides abscessus subsp. abscessus]|nr:Probable lipase/esterase LipG [Mycobacteroides abscessus subsp. abscessus]SHS35911.1 Probable lipase/esterase LipG [Mycobacteroides abscessus subsp. abscessus]